MRLKPALDFNGKHPEKQTYLTLVWFPPIRTRFIEVGLTIGHIDNASNYADSPTNSLAN